MPVIREDCPLCVQMNNSLKGRIVLCHGERMQTSSVGNISISYKHGDCAHVSELNATVPAHHTLRVRLRVAQYNVVGCQELMTQHVAPLSCS